MIKKEDKKIIIIAIGVLLLIVGIFSLFPSLEQKAQKISGKKPATTKIKDTSFSAVFLSWKEKNDFLLASFYITNNRSETVQSIEIECLVFDKNNEQIKRLNQDVIINIAGGKNKQFNEIKIGKLPKNYAKVGCFGKNYH